MNINETLICPKCNGVYFKVKREATYLYTYKLETPYTNERNTENESLPFLFDNREKIRSKEYLECETCRAQYACDLDELQNKIHFTILQKAIRSDFVNNPDFLG